MARILGCCGSGVGRQLQLRLDPLAWKPPYAAEEAQENGKKTKKKKKKERKKKETTLASEPKILLR